MTASPTSPLSQPTSDAAPRPLPLWASIPIVLVCLLAGGWIIHWYVGTHVRADEQHILGDAPARTAVAGGNRGAGARGFANRLGNMFARPPIRLVGRDPERGPFEVATGQARFHYLVRTGKPPVLNNFAYMGVSASNAFVPAEVWQTIYAAGRMVNDDRATKAAQLSADQVRQLKPLLGEVVMVVAEADRATLGADVTAYVSAAAKDRNGAQFKLLADLDAVAERSRAASKQSALDRATKINAVVTPQQWKQYQAMGGRP